MFPVPEANPAVLPVLKVPPDAIAFKEPGKAALAGKLLED